MANLVLVRIIRSDGKSFVLGTGAWRILSDGLKGIDFPNFSVYSDKNGVGDGDLLSGKRIDNRDVQVKCKSIDPRANAAIREATISFFNPKYTFKVYITYQGVTRWIEGELQGFSCPSENIYRPMALTVKFFCKDPMLKSVDDFGKDIASISAGFGFPYVETHLDDDPVIPAYADIYSYNHEVVIENDGDAMTYPRVTINFQGSALNPKIYKDNCYVRILGRFHEGDVVDIDFENCTIKKNGVNWIQNIDRSSTFTAMGLNLGDSKVGFSADDGDGNMAVYVYYNKLYLGL